MSAVGYTPAVEMLVDVLLKVPEEPGLEWEEEWNGDGKQEPALGWKKKGRGGWNMTLEHRRSSLHRPPSSPLSSSVLPPILSPQGSSAVTHLQCFHAVLE